MVTVAGTIELPGPVMYAVKLVTLAGSTTSEKLAITGTLRFTSVAPLAGLVVTTVGGVWSEGVITTSTQ